MSDDRDTEKIAAQSSRRISTKIVARRAQRQQKKSMAAKKPRVRRIPPEQQKKRGRRRSEAAVEQLLDFYAHWDRWPRGLSRPMQRYYAKHPRLCVEERRARVGVAPELAGAS